MSHMKHVGEGVLVDEFDTEIRRRYVNRRCVGMITKELIEDAEAVLPEEVRMQYDWFKPFGTYFPWVKTVGGASENATATAILSTCGNEVNE